MSEQDSLPPRNAGLPEPLPQNLPLEVVLRPTESVITPQQIGENTSRPSELIDPTLASVSEVTVFREETTTFRGPLPPPEILKEYNNIIGHGAERMMVMTEKAQSHRHQMDRSAMALKNRLLRAQATDAAAARKERNFGQRGGIWLCLILAASVVIVAVSGHPVTSAAVAAIGGAVGLYVHGHPTGSSVPAERPDDEDTTKGEDEK